MFLVTAHFVQVKLDTFAVLFVFTTNNNAWNIPRRDYVQISIGSLYDKP